jgi:hypothetical protein
MYISLTIIVHKSWASAFYLILNECASNKTNYLATACVKIYFIPESNVVGHQYIPNAGNLTTK